MKLILENPLNNGKTLKGADAYAFGLADAVFEGADFLEQSLLWAAAVLTARSPWTGPARPRRGLGRRGGQGPRASPRRRPAGPPPPRSAPWT